MKLAKFKIYKKGDAIAINFLEFNNESIFKGYAIKVDFKNKRVRHESSWHSSFINNDVFTITIGCCSDIVQIENSGRDNQLLRIPTLVETNYEYILKFDNEKYTAEFLIDRIIKTFAILSNKI